PIGKVKIDQPFEPHLQRFERAIDLCKILGTPNIRVFSYYKPEADDWAKWRGEVMARMEQKTRRAEKAGVRLLHENEHNIYGDDPRRVVDLIQTIDSPHLRAVYDAANYVFCGYDPWQGWQMTKALTAHFHIKDWIAGESHGCLAGEGQGRIPESIADGCPATMDSRHWSRTCSAVVRPAASRDRNFSPRRSRHSRASLIAPARNISNI